MSLHLVVRFLGMAKVETSINNTLRPSGFRTSGALGPVTLFACTLGIELRTFPSLSVGLRVSKFSLSIPLFLLFPTHCILD